MWAYPSSSIIDVANPFQEFSLESRLSRPSASGARRPRRSCIMHHHRPIPPQLIPLHRHTVAALLPPAPSLSLPTYSTPPGTIPGRHCTPVQSNPAECDDVDKLAQREYTPLSLSVRYEQEKNPYGAGTIGVIPAGIRRAPNTKERQTRPHRRESETYSSGRLVCSLVRRRRAQPFSIQW